MTLPDEEWDRKQEQHGVHMLQRLAWARFQSELGHEPVWSDDAGPNWIGFRSAVRGAKYLYVPYGPQSFSSSDLADALALLKVRTREMKLDFIRCEPIGVTELQCQAAGLRPTTSVQPTETSVLDLTADEATLRAGLSKGHRLSINGAERHGLETIIANEKDGLEEFLTLLQRVSTEREFRLHPKAYYRTMLATLGPMGAVHIGLCRHDGRLAAGAIALDIGETRAYIHAASDPEMRSLRAGAPLVWELILDGRRRGRKHFDFWGVAPVDATAEHPWYGFTQFKLGFGGSRVGYPGTWDLPVRTQRYAAYSLARRIARYPAVRRLRG